MSKVTKLVVEEFTVDETSQIVMLKGFKYSYFKDPVTGKYYRPKTTFEVTGEDLETLFDEVTDVEEATA